MTTLPLGAHQAMRSPAGVPPANSERIDLAAGLPPTSASSLADMVLAHSSGNFLQKSYTSIASGGDIQGGFERTLARNSLVYQGIFRTEWVYRVFWGGGFAGEAGGLISKVKGLEVLGVGSFAGGGVLLWVWRWLRRCCATRWIWGLRGPCRARSGGSGSSGGSSKPSLICFAASDIPRESNASAQSNIAGLRRCGFPGACCRWGIASWGRFSATKDRGSSNRRFVSRGSRSTSRSNLATSISEPSSVMGAWLLKPPALPPAGDSAALPGHRRGRPRLCYSQRSGC